MDNFVYFKANGLIKAKYKMTSLQNKIANLIFFKTDLMGAFREVFIKEGLSLYEININYKEVKEIAKKNLTFDEINNFLKDMENIKVYIYENKNKYTRTNFISLTEIHKEENIFTVYIYSTVYNAVKDKLQGNFTPIDLTILNNFKSVYSQRLYENLRAWTETKKVIDFKVDFLKQLFFLQDKYKRYNDFKKDCLVKAINEINKSGYMEIKFEEIKLGRKIDTIRFVVKDNLPRQKEKKVITEEPKKRNESQGSKKTLNFTNYSQREYDYDSLEKQLLGWDD
ncbi:replication initiation protein [Clostridium tarantellae]|uniref:RepB family plasmid replication initiator protein n=1 Tax=Clostridium tarantellae TaxID=39493 RepID=A0A6I1MN01_9CLOT|nr:replication initiation protein [Clostridium tarantellae]MPQ44340.1 RepB family plasmid replication initiator protein [Clostridium tarantellae]